MIAACCTVVEINVNNGREKIHLGKLDGRGKKLFSKSKCKRLKQLVTTHYLQISKQVGKKLSPNTSLGKR